MQEQAVKAMTGRRGLSYGWMVVAAGFVSTLIAGNFQYSFGVFVKPLIYQFGWSRAAISGCITVRNLSSSVANIAAGGLTDRYEPRKLVLAGILIAGLSYLLTSRINSVWQLYVYLGLLTGIGVSGFIVPLVATTTRAFGKRASLANGIMLSGFGAAQMIVPPLATYLILAHGWDVTYVVLGIAALLSAPVVWRLMRGPPDVPLAERVAAVSVKPEAIPIPPKPSGDYTLRQALRTATMWGLLLALGVAGAGYQLIMVHVVPAAIDIGISPEPAAVILTLSGITNAVGRVALGGLASKINGKIVLNISLATQALTLLALTRADSLLAFYIIVSIHSLAYGGLIPLMPSLAGRFFGTRAIGAIFGSINTAYTIGGAFGPVLAGYVFDVTGSYYIAFLSTAIVVGIIFVYSLALRPPRRKTVPAA